MRRRWSLAIARLILILAGGLLAHFTQTAGGIRILDVRFKGAKGANRNPGAAAVVIRVMPPRKARSWLERRFALA